MHWHWDKKNISLHFQTAERSKRTQTQNTNKELDGAFLQKWRLGKGKNKTKKYIRKTKLKGGRSKLQYSDLYCGK